MGEFFPSGKIEANLSVVASASPTPLPSEELERMFALLPVYSDLRSVFKQNGYSVREHESFMIIKKGSATLAGLKMGHFNAVFVNQWAQDSGVVGVSGFNIGFDQTGVRTKQGKLAAFSVRLLRESKDSGASLHQLDCKAIALFASNVIVKQVLVDGRDTVEPFGELFVLEGAPIVKKGDFVCEDGGSSTIVFYDEDEGPEQPFYYAIDMKRRNMVSKTISPGWLKAIRDGALSHSYDAERGILYVSNTLGASYGFPPSAKHLQMAKLNLEEKATKNIVALCESVPSLSCADWEPLVERFVKSPNRVTYQQLVGADIVKVAFEWMNKLDEYKLGSNKRTQTGEIRKTMLGLEKSKTYEEYAEIVTANTVPKGAAYYLINLCRLHGLVRNAPDGKIYYGTC